MIPILLQKYEVYPVLWLVSLVNTVLWLVRIMRFIDLRRRLCQDKSDLAPTPTKHKSEGGFLFNLRKSESRTSLHIDLDGLQHKLSLSPSPDLDQDEKTSSRFLGGCEGNIQGTIQGNSQGSKSDLFQRLSSPSGVNNDCDNDSGEQNLIKLLTSLCVWY